MSYQALSVSLVPVRKEKQPGWRQVNPNVALALDVLVTRHTKPWHGRGCFSWLSKLLFRNQGQVMLQSLIFSDRTTSALPLHSQSYHCMCTLSHIVTLCFPPEWTNTVPGAQILFRRHALHLSVFLQALSKLLFVLCFTCRRWKGLYIIFDNNANNVISHCLEKGVDWSDWWCAKAGVWDNDA